MEGQTATGPFNVDSDGVINGLPSVLGDDDCEGSVEGEYPPLIPEAEYEACYVDYETKTMGRGSILKLAVRFALTAPGPHEGTRLTRNYNVTGLKGAARKRGGFKVGWGSDYMLDYVSVLGRPERPDRMSPVHFKGRILRVRVRTVKTNWKGATRPPGLHYSVIDSILGEA